MTMTEPLIELRHVVIGYDRPLIKPISIRIEKGDFWGVVGPNGAGKSTLVKTLMRLIRPLAGRIHIPNRRLKFGYVPQRHALNPDYPLSVFDVTIMGRYDRIALGRRPSAKDQIRVIEELHRVGMSTGRQRPFNSLSGGEKQRVLLARALVSDPDVLVLDEPTEGVDLVGESEILNFLSKLHTEHKKTILMIGHHMSEVISIVDHLCLINRHTDLFETGSTKELLDEEHLSRVFGKPIEIDSCEQRSHMHIKDLGDV